MTTFLQDCLTDKALVEQVDEAVDAWHASASTASLGDYLGFTAQEYEQRLKNPAILPAIVSQREEQIKGRGMRRPPSKRLRL